MPFSPSNESDWPRPGTRKRKYLGYSRAWTFDSDADDLAEEYLNYNKLPLNYKQVSIILLLNYYKHSNEYRPTWKRIYRYLMKSLDEIINSNDDMLTQFNEGKFSYADRLRDIINNAKDLYYEFVFDIPMAKTEGVEDEITLYSGLSASKLIIVENLEKLSSDQSYLLPTFIASSLSRDTALRFTDPNYKVMIHLKIPESKLNVFPYRPLFKKKVEFPLSLERTIEELELLLPPYCEVIFKGKKQENLSFYRNVVKNGRIEAEQQPAAPVDIYELEFVSFCELRKGVEQPCNKTPNDLEKECIENLLDPMKNGLDPLEDNLDSLENDVGDETGRPSKRPRGGSDRGGTKRRKKKNKKSKRKKKNKPKYKNKKQKRSFKLNAK